MSNNPLKQYFRRPAVYLKLPSGGKDYPPGVINSTETNELPVFPMTAIDEITSKTPDALYNGTAVVEIIKSCVPNIIDPWQITNTDLNAVLIAIKAASGSQNLELNSTCTECKESSTYALDLIKILSTLQSPDYTVPLVLGDLTVKFRPLNYKQINEAGLIQFEIQKSFANVERIEDPKEKLKAIRTSLLDVTKITIELIAKTIKYISTPTINVENYDHILEFLQNCDKTMYESIRDYHNNLKEQTELKSLDVKCINCSHEYKQPYTLNLSDFFG